MGLDKRGRKPGISGGPAFFRALVKVRPAGKAVLAIMEKAVFFWMITRRDTSPDFGSNEDCGFINSRRGLNKIRKIVYETNFLSFAFLCYGPGFFPVLSKMVFPAGSSRTPKGADTS